MGRPPGFVGCTYGPPLSNPEGRVFSELRAVHTPPRATGVAPYSLWLQGCFSTHSL